MDRKFWVPVNVSYSDYYGNYKVRDKARRDYENDLHTSIGCCETILEPGSFLYFKEFYAKQLARLYDEVENASTYFDCAIELLQNRISENHIYLTDGQALTLGIIIGQNLRDCDITEKLRNYFKTVERNGDEEKRD